MCAHNTCDGVLFISFSISDGHKRIPHFESTHSIHYTRLSLLNCNQNLRHNTFSYGGYLLDYTIYNLLGSIPSLVTLINVVIEISYTLFGSTDAAIPRFFRPYPICPLLHWTPVHLSKQTFTVPRNCTYVDSGNLNARNLATKKSPSTVLKLSNKYGSTEHLFYEDEKSVWNYLFQLVSRWTYPLKIIVSSCVFVSVTCIYVTPNPYTDADALSK